MKRANKKDSESCSAIKSVILGVVLCGLGGCGTLQKGIRDATRPMPLNSPSTGDKAMVYNEIAVAQRQRNEVFVQIIASDIELPLTAGPSRPNETRTYSIDVWFDDSVVSDGGVEAAIKNGEIIVEVLGASAKIRTASYGEKKTGLIEKSRGKLVVELDSRDLTQSFTVIAKAVRHSTKWQEEQDEVNRQLTGSLETASKQCQEACVEYLTKHSASIVADGSASIPVGERILKNSAAAQAHAYLLAGEQYEKMQAQPNPYMAVKTVRVFNGDLHTQIYMLSDEESRDAFGSNFSKYFYVGKAYFRNQHSDKKLIVHTTSLRAKTVFYREPVNGRSGQGFWKNIFRNEEDSKHNHESGSAGIERYDYVSRDIDRKRMVAHLLSIGEENQILDIVWSDEIFKQLLARNKDGKPSDEEIRKSIDEKIRSAGIESQGDAIKFANHALDAASSVVSKCKLPSHEKQDTGPQAELYSRALMLASTAMEPKNLAERLRPVVAIQEGESKNKFLDCIIDSRKDFELKRARYARAASPATIDLRKRVGLMDKIASASRDTYWQQRLAKHGYMWHDYYRPMTFEAVLLSLSAKTKQHPGNRIADWLQSIGVVAGSLVGLTDISSRFGTEGFTQRVVYATSVFVPELNKLIMRDLDQYLANLSATALPSIITLAPNESRDGYVFFPRGPIYGYGIDEFSLNDPSYIVNIDNEDVAVDGALIEGELAFASGQRAVDMVQSARDQGKSTVAEDMKKLADLQAKVFAYQLQHIANTTCEMIASGNKNQAQQYLAKVKNSIKAASESALIVDLSARADQLIECDKPLPVSSQGSGKNAAKP